MILLSSHLDRVIQNYDVQYRNGIHRGLLDNFAGVLLTYLTIYDDPQLAALEKEGSLRIWHNQGEEWGRLTKPPKVKKTDLVICVDVWCPPRKCDFSLDNMRGFSKQETKDIREWMEWEGFNPLMKRYTGNPDEHDESFEWRGKVNKALVFSIPIKCKNDGWHRIQQDNTVSYETMAKCRQGLKRLICGPLAEYLE